MKTATVVETVKTVPGDFYVQGGAKAIYKLSEPLTGYDEKTSDHVYVSTASVMGQPETYAFLCDEKGEVLSWTELPCSMKGVASHAEVLADAGYELAATLPNGKAEDT